KKKKSPCPCKEISFLIFQEGNNIITGGRSWNQVVDGYNVITKIMKDEYYNIIVDSQQTDNKNKYLPAQIAKKSEDGKKDIIYLNKKQRILEHPRNYYLLKKLGLLHNYVAVNL